MAYKKSAVTKERLLNVSAKLFREKGYYDTTIKDIAKEAEVAHPCVYYYFKNKESIAREIVDQIFGRIFIIIEQLYQQNPDYLLNTLVEYILYFKHIAMNKTTQAVYYDLVQYSNYNLENLNRLQNTAFNKVKSSFEAHNVDSCDNAVKAYILTSDAFAKALFKGVISGLISYTFEEAVDYFFRHVLVDALKISEQLYLEKLNEAYKICDSIPMEEIACFE